VVSLLPDFEFMRPAPSEKAFDSPEWLFELKYDGLRALACCDGQVTKLMSSKGREFDNFSRVAAGVTAALSGITAVLDGEIVSLDASGKPRFEDLLSGRGRARFYAFDLLMLSREDLRPLPLLERKRLLNDIVPDAGLLRPAPHIMERGTALFDVACRHDLEGIVAKWRYGAYSTDALPTWLQVRNPDYSQRTRGRQRAARGAGRMET
jgi:bifunctional non-homologous end joining protein LigD